MTLKKKLSFGFRAHYLVLIASVHLTLLCQSALAESEQVLTIAPNEFVQFFKETKAKVVSAQKIILSEGRLRYSCKKNCSFTIDGLIFSAKKLSGEGEIRLDNVMNRLHFETREGQLFAEVTGRKETQALESFSAQVFTGEKNWAHDLLLKEKKAIRGEWSVPKAKVPRENFNIQATMKKQSELRQKAIQNEKLKKTPSRNKNTVLICKNPEAALNECEWLCEDASKGLRVPCTSKKISPVCVRYRCNAAGNWADRTLMANLEICQSLALKTVQNCNY